MNTEKHFYYDLQVFNIYCKYEGGKIHSMTHMKALLRCSTTQNVFYDQLSITYPTAGAKIPVQSDLYILYHSNIFNS